MNEKKVSLTIDGRQVSVPAESTIMQAAESIGIHIPRLCYHSRLSVAGACRICVVEVEGMKNYVPSCCTQVSEGMMVRTNTADLLRTRRDIIELLLDNHPQDCQTCSRNGDCELQSLAEQFGIRERIFEGEKKHFPADYSSLSIVRDPDKCILCGKCVRVCSEIQGVNALSFSHRGFRTNVGPAFDLPAAESVCINCGQCTLFCPTGALTEQDDTEKVWQALNDPDKIVVVQIAPAVRVAIGEPFGYPPGTDLTGQTVAALRRLGFDRVFDTQFSADLTIMEEAHELIHRLSHNGKLPMFTSCSPGWIKFCEHFHPEFLENLSTCKSPQQMMGAIIKTYYAEKQKIDPSVIYSVSIMPCTAKKFEANRPEMRSSGFQDVDAVLTTRELARMIKKIGLKFSELPGEEFDDPLGESTGAATIFGVTGGVLEAALRTAYELVTGDQLLSLDFHQVRGFEGIREAEIALAGKKIRVAVCHGLSNTHRLLTEIKTGQRTYHFVEIMTCPGGCLGGGGQPRPPEKTEPMDRSYYEKRAAGIYAIDSKKVIRQSHKNPQIKKIYAEFLEKPLGARSHHLLHTRYQVRSPRGFTSVREDIFNL